MRHCLVLNALSTIRSIRSTAPSYVTVISLLLLYIVAPVKADELSNQYCPVTTSELAEEQFSVEYEGKQIYFCCSKCKKDFLNDPQAYLANLESPALEPEHGESSHDHGETAHEHVEQAAEVAAEGHTADTNSSHDHATDHGESSSLVGFAGKFHPMVTHFPIALVLSALLFSILSVALKIQALDMVSVYSVYLAAVTGLVTVILGLAAGYGASYPSFLTGYLVTHRLLGIVTGVLTIVTAYLGHRQLRTKSHGSAWLYRGFLLASSVLVGITGHFGATLVFGPDHLNY